MSIYSLCVGYWFNVSLFPSLVFPWNYILSSHVSVRPCCGCNSFVSLFICCIPKCDFWFLFCLFVYLFSSYFNCRLQYFYHMPFHILLSHIVSCWLCITNFIHSYNLYLFWVFFIWRIFFLVERAVIIILYVFFYIC